MTDTFFLPTYLIRRGVTAFLRGPEQEVDVS